MFLGVAIGDQLGRCAEGMTPTQIKNNYGVVTNYRCPANRHWKNKKARVWTDDTQLTLATARAMINAGKFDMDAVAQEHIKAYDESVAGWGGSTREAVERIKNGVHWRKSGKTEKTDRGHGNGVAMKIAPLAAFNFLLNPHSPFPHLSSKDLINFTLMTHHSFPAISGTITNFTGLEHCLRAKPENFLPYALLYNIYDKLHSLPLSVKKYNQNLCPVSYREKCYWWESPDEMELEHNAPVEVSMHKLLAFPVMKMSHAYDWFGNGGCLIYHSLPFAYAFFLTDHNSFDAVIRVVNAGGDTDTTGSIVASLLGALHGEEIFPKHLIRNLQDPELIIDTADRFYKTFA